MQIEKKIVLVSSAIKMRSLDTVKTRNLEPAFSQVSLTGS